MNVILRLAGMVAAIALASPAPGAFVLYSAAGTGPAGIQGQVDAFRADLGQLNPNVAGSFGSGRREINWDGVPNTLAAPNDLPPNFFNVNSPRGAVFAGPGSGFRVSGNAGAAPIEFDEINPTYSSLFTTFSPQRLFTGLGSPIVDVLFFVPGSTTPAVTTGFGAVFTDVDLPDVTRIEFFDLGNHSLGVFSVPQIAGNETLSFLGVDFNAPIVSRVRITSGNTALGPNETGGLDVVAMDDFIYGEPGARTTVPEPATLALIVAALAGLASSQRRRR